MQYPDAVTWVIIGSLNIEAYIQVLYPLWVVDCLRSLKGDYWSLVTIGCPYQPLIQWVIVGNLNFEAYFEMLCQLWMFNSLYPL